MKYPLFLCAALTLAGGAALAQDAPISAADFARNASVGNTFEVQESQLALHQAKSPKVKMFARMMIKDHSAAEKKLQIAAKVAGVPEMQVDSAHQAMLDAIKGKTGADFDAAYIADQTQAHKDAEGLITSYETNGTDPKLKTWATQTLPAVKMHLQKIENL